MKMKFNIIKLILIIPVILLNMSSKDMDIYNEKIDEPEKIPIMKGDGYGDEKVIKVIKIDTSENATKWGTDHLVDEGRGNFYRAMYLNARIRFKLDGKFHVNFVEIDFFNGVDTEHTEVSEFNNKDYSYFRYKYTLYYSNGHENPSPFRDFNLFSQQNIQSDNTVEGFERVYPIRDNIVADWLMIKFTGNNMPDNSQECLIDEIRFYGYEVDTESTEITPEDIPVEDNDPDNPDPLVNPPSTPDNFTANSVSKEKIQLSWLKGSLNTKGYEILASDNSNFKNPRKIILSSSVTTYSDNGLKPSTTYYYKIRAYNKGGYTTYVGPRHATTHDFAGNELIEPIILDNDYWGTDGDVELEGWRYWQSYSHDKAHRSECARSRYYSSGNQGDAVYIPNIKKTGKYSVYMWWPYYSSNLDEISVRVFYSGGPSYGKQYIIDQKKQSNCEKWYRIGNFNFKKGNSGKLVIEGESYKDNIIADGVKFVYNHPIPADPSNLNAATLSYDTINLTWKDKSDNEKGFKIFRKKDSEKDYTEIFKTGANVKTYIDEDLIHLTTYSYKVMAYNDDYVSSFSNIAVATTFDLPPVRPNDLTTDTVTETTIGMKWTDNSDNEDGFELWRKKDGETDFTLYKTLPENSTAYLDENLDVSTAYMYKILAFNNGGKSEYTNILVEKTLEPITIITPDKDSEWKTANIVNIKWKKRETVPSVKIELFRGDELVDIINDNNDLTNDEYRILSDLEEGSDYSVKITSTSNIAFYAVSDTFNIDKTMKKFSFKSPNKNTYWEIGYEYDITWIVQNALINNNEQISLFLHNNDNHEELKITNSTIDVLTESYLVPVDLTAGENYQVFIDSHNVNMSFSENFQIGHAMVKIIQPDATSDWDQNEEQLIRFFKSKSVKKAGFELYKGDVKVLDIGNNIETEDTHEFTMPNDLEPDKDYRIKIYDSDHSNDTFAFSEYFKINPPKPAFPRIETDLTLPDDNTNHWIPNIEGDPLSGINVNITGKTALNADVILTEYHNNIRILAPVDPYWRQDEYSNVVAVNNSNSNINNNRGDCDYGFYAVHEDDKYLLATFYRDGDETNNMYKVDYNNLYIYNDSDNEKTYGKAKEEDGYFLRTDLSSGNLYFRLDTIDQTCDTFEIAVIDDSGNIRPGDDLQFRFALADYPEFTDIVHESDFIAVYDKILLNRVNQYLDERVDNDNGLPIFRRTRDENNNLILPDETQEEYLERLNKADWNKSDQIVIKPFTYFCYDQNSNTNRDTYGAVAYSYADQDNIEEYNDYMNQQFQILRWYYGNNNPRWVNNQNPHPEWATWNGPDGNMGSIQNHVLEYSDDTLAPDGSWDNYRSINNFNNLPVVIEGEMYYPFQPSYALYWFMRLGANYQWYYAGQSAGVDCVGLVQRSASYDDNNYSLPDIPNWPWTLNNNEAQPYYSNRRMLVIEDDDHRNYHHLWEISRGPDTVQNNPQNLEKIIPGDILYYWWDNTPDNNLNDDAYHVAMVLSVEYNENSREVEIENIQLIESTFGRDNQNQRFGKVINFRNVNTYDSNNLYQNWIIGRLIINN